MQKSTQRFAERQIPLQKQFDSLIQAGMTLIAYGLVVSAFHLLNLTLVTFVSIPSLSSLSELSMRSGIFSILYYSLAAFAFTSLWKSIFPERQKSDTSNQKLFPLIVSHLRAFTPGFTQGLFTASCFAAALMLGGIYQYLGAFLHYEETYTFALNFGLRTLSLLLLFYFEEFIFWRNILFLVSLELL